MFKKINYKKIDFIKNATKDGGAQDEVLNTLETGKLPIHIQNKKNGRMWGQATEKQILNMVDKNIGLYEVIHSYPHKVYFDIDKTELEENYLEKVKQIILDEIPDAKLSISGSETDNKLSYHIVVNNYIITNDEEKTKLKLMVKNLNKKDNGFDWKVYTKNRNMKCINQSKINKPVQKIIEDDETQNHLITCFIDKDSKVFNPDIEVAQDVEHTQKQFNKFDWASIPQMTLELPKDIDLSSPKDLLKITPLDSSYDHRYTHRVARFCYYNGLTFDDFISWYKNKSSDNENLKKWSFHWKNLVKFNPISISYYTKILANFYPNIDEKAEMIDIVKQFDMPNKNIKYIDSLSQKHFKTSKKALIFNIGMGGGKTINTIQYLQDKESFCWLTPNIALASNTFTRLKENKVNVTYYDSGKNAKQKANLIGNSDKLIICLNSMKYIQKNYKVVVIDEIETFLKIWHDNGTLNDETLNACWITFVNLLKNCEKLILLDAFLSKLTTNFLNKLGITYKIVRRNKEVNDRKAIVCQNFKYWTSDLIHNIKQGKRCLIFYPRKTGSSKLPSMDSLRHTIEKETNKKGIHHHADVKDSVNQKLFDVNKHWKKYDFVISNNKINVGLNFDLKHFDLIYLSIASYNSPRDIVQFSYRARNIADDKVKYCFIDSRNSNQNFIHQTVKKDNTLYQSLIEDIIIEKRAPLKGSFEFFLNLAGYDIQNKILKTEILKEYEFEANDYYDYTKIYEINDENIKDVEKELYARRLNIHDKLALKKYYFKKQFKKGTDEKFLTELWNDKKLNFVSKIKEILTKENVLDKLKSNYGWSLHFPEKIEKDFKLDKADIQLIFNTVKFKDLNEKSSHKIIIKNFINTYYGSNIITSKYSKHKECIYSVNQDYVKAFIMIQKNIKLNLDVDFQD